MTDEMQNTPLDGNENGDIQDDIALDAGLSENDRQKLESELKRARKDAAKYRQQARDAQANAESATSQLSQLATVEEALQAIQKRLDAETQARQTAELQAIKMQVVANVGLPPDLAEFVKGDTQEEILVSAQRLADRLPKGSLVVPRVGQGAEAPTPSRAKEIHARITGTSSDVFNPDIARNLGGGIHKGD